MDPTHLTSSDLFFNRELSWLAFNERVLEEALDPKTPLLERLKFLSIFTTNLDEFFMVRVAGLKKMLKEGFVQCESPDGLPIQDVLRQIKIITDRLIERQYTCLKEVLGLLKSQGLWLARVKDELSQEEKRELDSYFKEHVFPILTPLAVDSTHPYPFLTNLANYLVVEFTPKMTETHRSQESFIGFVEIPAVLPRLIPLTQGKKWVLLEDLVTEHLEDLFLGFSVVRCSTVRVTRNLDYTLLENRVVDLLESIQKAVINRQHQEAVRLEVAIGTPQDFLDQIGDVLKLSKTKDIYWIPGPIFLTGLMGLYQQDAPHLKEPSFNPRLPAAMSGNQNIFALIRQKDLLVHHPYESFYAVTEFLGEAATDPAVLAIKQTLYRTSGDSPIIESLIKAAENGKHVTAVVELKARFDEKNNILWARRLERAGVNVVYGFVGLKTHCKATLVVRKENDELIRYVHLSTGNYNSQTAKFYCDIGLFSADSPLSQDVSALFNLLTGFNILGEKGQIKDGMILPHFQKLILAPVHLREWFENQIEQGIESAKKGTRVQMTVKINGLVDRKLITKLYEASQAGVSIQLLVRGICALKPGVPGLSERIQVRSVIDRFLEHSRIYHFSLGDVDRVYLGSADWMTRSFGRRIEMVFPVEEPSLKKRLIQEILHLSLADNQKARILQPDGTYRMISPKKGEAPLRSQERFIHLARQEGIKSIPYEKAVRSYKGKRKSVRSPLASKQDP
jgi:polyphosphate kinase